MSITLAIIIFFVNRNIQLNYFFNSSDFTHYRTFTLLTM